MYQHLKCYLTLEKDFSSNNLVRSVQVVLMKCHACQTARQDSMINFIKFTMYLMFTIQSLENNVYVTQGIKAITPLLRSIKHRPEL